MNGTDEPRLRRLLRRRLWLARAALTWESLWPAVWPMVGVAGLFVGIALLDVLPLLPPWLHTLLLAGFVSAFGVAVWRGLSRFEPATEEQARRRIERDSALAHRPLAVLDDKMAGNPRDAMARALWHEHRRRMAAAVARLRVRLPSPGMAAKDPLGLRAAVLLLLVIGLAGARWDAGERILRALIPPVSGTAVESVVAQLWLTPPAHTGLPPIFLEVPASQAQPAALVLPAGTAVLSLVQGGGARASLRIGERKLEFDRLGDGSQRLEGRIDGGDVLSIHAGTLLARWPLGVVADAVPSIAFTQPPQTDDGQRLRLSYELSDDYGIAKAWASVRRIDRPSAEPLVVDLPVPGGGGKQGRMASRHDLTAHAWAGLPVSITPTAQDALGQTGSGEPVNTVLPERSFRHPVARAVVALRKRLVDATAKDIAQVVWGLDGISAAPEAFGHDSTVFLALRTARARLHHAPTPQNVESTREILWNAALRIEEGDRGVAERALEEAARALDKALEEGASQEEIERLMDQLQQAMDQYMQALAEQMMKQGLEPMPLDPGTDTISPEELQAMMDRMRETARLGSRAAAQQMLSELRDMLDNLRAGMQGQPMAGQMRQAQQALGELGKLAREQQQLMDQTFRQAQRQGGPEGQAMQQGAGAQEALRRRLGDLMRQLGEAMGDIPQGLGDAEQSMRDATGQLMRNDPGGAAEMQGQALQQLQEGAQAAMQALSQQMQQGQQGFSGMQNSGGMRRDPLGRRMRSPLADDGSVHVPDEAEMHRAREVLDELRRRAGQPQRPQSERDYLQRLLKPF